MLGYADRVEPLREYCAGLLLPGERKSVEPMAAVVAHRRLAAKHQSLLHFVGESAWSDESLLAKVRELVLPAIEARGFRRGRKAVARGSAGQTQSPLKAICSQPRARQGSRRRAEGTGNTATRARISFTTGAALQSREGGELLPVKRCASAPQTLISEYTLCRKGARLDASRNPVRRINLVLHSKR